MFEISCPKMMDDGPEDTARLLLSDTDYSDDVDAGEPTADKEDGNDDVIVSTGKALDQDPQQVRRPRPRLKRINLSRPVLTRRAFKEIPLSSLSRRYDVPS